MQRRSSNAVDQRGNVIDGATVTVNLASTGATATIYSTAAGAAKSNPITVDSDDGSYFYYARNGRYSEVLAATDKTFDSAQTTDIELYDRADEGVYDVEDTRYGAKGDWNGSTGTDDTIAIQAALTAAGAAGGGDVILHGDHGYKTTATLTIPDRVRLRGYGVPSSTASRETAIIAPTSAVSIGISSGTAAAVAGGAIENLSVVMTSMPVGAKAILLDGVWMFTVGHVKITGLPDATATGLHIRGNAALARGSLYNYLHDITVAQSGAMTRQGIGIKVETVGAEQVNALTIINTRVSRLTTGFKISDSGSGNVYINCNSETNTGNGVEITGTESGSEVIWIGGEVNNNDGWGFYGSTGRVTTFFTVMASNDLGEMDTSTLSHAMRTAGVLDVTAALNFGDTATDAVTDLTITVPGLTTADHVIVSVPNNVMVGAPAITGACGFIWWISATETVTVRFWNKTGSNINPVSGNFRVKGFKT